MHLRLLFLLVAIFPWQVYAEVNFKSTDFEIKLDSDWTRTVLIGAEHFYFESKSKNVSLKIDSLRGAIKPDNFVNVANKLIEFGIKKELKGSPTTSFTITNQTVSQSQDGMRATYTGRDSTKRSFKMVGFIQENKVVHLYFETPTRYEDQLESVVSEVLVGFKH